MSNFTEKRYIYPPKLEEYIRKNKFIPRKIRKNEHLKMYHRYWLEDYNDIVKVEDIFFTSGVEYYSVKYNSMNSCISAPVTAIGTYELLYNKDCIEKLNLINSDTSYTGAEIKYWFILNNIDLKHGAIYAGFWSFLNPNSNNLLIDNKYYFVSYNKSRKQKCQIILDKSKL